MLPAKRVDHRRSLVSAFSDIWTSVSQYSVNALSSSQYVANLAEGVATRALQNIKDGRLDIITPTHTYRFTGDYEAETTNMTETLEASIVVHQRTFFLRLLASPDLGFAEAYMYGDIDVDSQHLINVFRIFILSSRSGALTSLTSTTLTKVLSIPAQLTADRFVASLDNSRANISAHYDLGNEIFKAFLSSDMTYSCAIFPSLDADIGTPEGSESESLFNAQLSKLRHIIRKADIRNGHHVLEIGSGWGSLAFLIAESIKGTTIDTITLSSQQAEYVKERIKVKGLEKRVKVHLMDYRAMPAEWEGAFDRVVSVEMLEAVGKEYYETYFSKIDWALKKDTGVGVVQSITIPEGRYEEYVKTEDFIRKWSTPFFHASSVAWFSSIVSIVFPGGILPTVTSLTSALASGSSGRLLVESMSNIGPHYARTLREWRRRFDAGFNGDGTGRIEKALRDEYTNVMNGPRGREEIEVFRRKWLYYFCYCEVGFTMRLLGVHIITFVREGYVDYGCHTFN